MTTETVTTETRAEALAAGELPDAPMAMPTQVLQRAAEPGRRWFALLPGRRRIGA